MNLQLVAGPALGGLLAGLAGVTAAFALNAGSFFASALLLTRLGPLPPAPGGTRDGVVAEIRAGLHYVARHRLVFGVVYSAAQLASVAAYLAASVLTALTSPRATFLIASAGMLGAGNTVAGALSHFLGQSRPAGQSLMGGTGQRS